MTEQKFKEFLRMLYYGCFDFLGIYVFKGRITLDISTVSVLLLECSNNAISEHKYNQWLNEVKKERGL